MAAEFNPASLQANDDVLTVCAISLLAASLGNVLHEGLGHATTALLTGTKSGVLSTVAWSSDFDSRLVAAGGTLVNRRPPWFYGLQCSRRRTYRFTCVSFCSQVLRLTSWLAPA